MQNKQKIDFTQYSIGDIAHVHKDMRPLWPEYDRDFEIIDITPETVTLGGKYCCKPYVFGTDGELIDPEKDFMHITGMTQRSSEEKAEQAKLKEQYKELSAETSKLKEQARKDIEEMLKPIKEYCQENNIDMSFSTMFMTTFPHISLDIHKVRTSKELEEIAKKIYP